MRTVASRIRAASRVLVILLAVALAECGRGSGGPQAPQPLQGAIVILLDTVRADHLSCYGYGQQTSPALDGLAERGVLFEQTIAAAPWTLPSVVSLLAGRYTDRVYDGQLRQSLVEHFRDAGIATAAITEGAWVSRAFGLDLGFRDWTEEEGEVQLLEQVEGHRKNARGGIANTFRLAREWLARHRGERFLLVVHTYEPHAPYTGPPFPDGPTSERVGPAFTISFLDDLQSGKVLLDERDVNYVRRLYDGDLRRADAHVGSLVSYLEEIGLAERTLVVVTSDHGEEMGDHFPARLGDHGHDLRDSLIRVPLILVDPRHTYPMRRVAAQARVMDVLPTIAELLGVPIPDPLDGKSLLPMMEGVDRTGHPAFAAHTRAGPSRMAIRTLGYKYILTEDRGEQWPSIQPEPPARQLFDLSKDAQERINLAGERPELAAELEQVLRDTLHEIGGLGVPAPPSDLDPAVLERLRSLGYIR